MATVTKLNLNALLIDWSDATKPADFISWQLVRRYRAFPASYQDGTIVYSGADTSAEDTGLLGGIDHYYSLYANTTPGVVLVTEKLICDFPYGSFGKTEPYGYATKLYDMLPSIYRRKDVLENLHLRDFLKIPGRILEQLRTVTDRQQVAIDVDEIDYRHLKYIGEFLGWNVNNELPILRQREELKNAVRAYRMKGTRTGLIHLVEVLTGWNAQVQDCWQNILLTNDVNKTTFDFTDPDAATNLGRIGDVSFYTPNFESGGYPNFNRILIYLEATTNYQILTIIENKLQRIFNTFLPAGMEAIMVISLSAQELIEGEDLVEETAVQDDYFDNTLLTYDIDGWGAEGYPVSPIFGTDRTPVTNSLLFNTYQDETIPPLPPEPSDLYTYIPGHNGVTNSLYWQTHLFA